MKKKILKKLKKIRLLISDVDGVLTDGGMYYSEKGEILKKFNAKDGMGVEILLRSKVKTILLTRENSSIVKKRGAKIKAAATYIGTFNKELQLHKICKKFQVSPTEIAYIGDDLNDSEIMKLVGFAATPSDGIKDLRKIVDYVCRNNGGNGAFREIADLIVLSRR
jgi:YrbI family 3-deoxy-D-manno-octulosonate 8-phosphate phosphatase